MITVSCFPPVGTVQTAPPIDCLEAEQACVSDAGCVEVYHVLEYCSAEEAVAPLGPEARRECLEAQSTLLYYRPLQECKCHRGSRREELCLRVYWTVRFAGASQEKSDVVVDVLICLLVCFVCLCKHV